MLSDVTPNNVSLSWTTLHFLVRSEITSSQSTSSSSCCKYPVVSAVNEVYEPKVYSYTHFVYIVAAFVSAVDTLFCAVAESVGLFTQGQPSENVPSSAALCPLPKILVHLLLPASLLALSPSPLACSGSWTPARSPCLRLWECVPQSHSIVSWL